MKAITEHGSYGSFGLEGVRPSRAHLLLVEGLRLVLVFLGSLPVVLPIFGEGLPGPTHDAEFHLYRLVDFDQAFRSGILFPRIAPHLLLNYGYAAFIYYPPLAVYLGEGLHLIGLDLVAALKASFAVSALLAGLGAYALARQLIPPTPAVLVGLVYVFLPYRLLDTFVRGDLAESLALAILPFALLGLCRSVLNPTRYGIIITTLGVGLVVLSHTISAVVAAPFLFGFLILQAWPRPSSRSLGALSLAGVLALGLSASYWLPVLVQLPDLNTAALTSGTFDYHLHFIPTSRLIQPGWFYDYRFIPATQPPFIVGQTQLLVAILASIWVGLARPTGTRYFLAAALAIPIYLWLEQPGAAVVWDRLPVANFIQFPYRLEVGVCLATVILVAGFFAAVPHKRPGRPWIQRVGYGLGTAAIAGLVVTSYVQIPRGRVPITDSQANIPTMLRIESLRGLVAGTTGLDYLPRWGGKDYTVFKRIEAGFPPGAPIASPVQLTAVSFTDAGIRALAQSSASSTIILDHLYYRGWTGALDGHPIPVGPVGSVGRIGLQIPAGEHSLVLAYTGTWSDQVGIILSAAAVLVLAGLAIGFSQPGWRRRSGLAVVMMIVLALGLNYQLRPPQQLAGAGFGPIRLAGSRLDRVPTTPTDAIDVDLLWESEQAPLGNCVVHLRLIDRSGRVVASRDKAPLFGLRDCSTWGSGELVDDLQQIRLPPGASAGTYRLAVGLTIGDHLVAPAPDDSAPSVVNVPGVGPSLILGTVSASPPPPQPRLIDGRPVGAEFGGMFALDRERLQLNGQAVAPDGPILARIHPGDMVSLDLLWRSVADAPADYTAFVQLINSSQKPVAQDEDWPDHGGSPTSTRFPGDTTVGHYTLKTAGNLSPGLYPVIVAMYPKPTGARLQARGDYTQRDRVVLGTIKVMNADQTFGDVRASAVAVGSQPNFGGEIRLLASELTIVPGQVTVNLTWKALRRPSADYTVFVHLIDSQGHLVAQHDGPPLDGTLPTTFWDSGDTVFDQATITLPKNLPTETYTVQVGLYRLDTGARLATGDGRTAFPVGTVDQK